MTQNNSSTSASAVATSGNTGNSGQALSSHPHQLNSGPIPSNTLFSWGVLSSVPETMERLVNIINEMQERIDYLETSILMLEAELETQAYHIGGSEIHCDATLPIKISRQG
jgi:hypothetical protein